MRNILEFIKNNKFNIFLVICYLIITTITMFHHEIWRDEAQAWCIARDCNLFEIINMARVEGHPLFWYLLILPFAKAGFPVISMQIISLLLVFISVLILIFKAPFNNFQKIITVFSAGILYYIPIVARNYALIPLLLFSLAVLWNKRNEHPYIFAILIILLANTHIYMLGCCLGLFSIFIFENYKNWGVVTLKGEHCGGSDDEATKCDTRLNKKATIPLLMLILNFTCLFLFFHNVQNQNYALEVQEKSFPTIYSLILFISQIYIHPIIAHIQPLIKYFNIISIISFIPCLLVIFYRFYKLNKKVFIIAFCSIGFVISVFYFVYLNGIIYQKTFLLLLLLLFCYWMINTKDKILAVCINILFAISFIVSPLVITDEIKYNFSGGKQIADYIKQNLSDESTFIAFGSPYVYSSISAYLPDKKFYNVISNSYISYFSFKIQNKKEAQHPQNNDYFIIQDNITELDKMGFKILFQSDKENISSRTEQEIFKICYNTEL